VFSVKETLIHTRNLYIAPSRFMTLATLKGQFEITLESIKVDPGKQAQH